MLPDKRFDNGESLAGTRCADYPCASERIADVHPTFAELPLVIVAHGDIDRILVLLQLPALLKTLVLKIETVFQQSLFEELGNVVKGDVYQYHADY